MFDTVFELLGVGAAISPLLLLVIIGLPMLLGSPLKERVVAVATECAVVAGLMCSIGILALMLASGRRDVPIELRHWVSLPAAHFHLHFSFEFDRLSVPFVILTYVLVGTITAFASRYLHREAGYQRFFLLNAMFLLGMVVASIAQTIETLFVGWELVGLSSALLVAYFHERPAPVLNGQRVWSTYRITDAAFLLAAVVLHRLPGEGQFSQLIGHGPWPSGDTMLSPTQAILVGALLLVAVAGKSALVPFSGWLPRAMEGPTPSSAIFYGALSVHLGAFLLLRISPLLNASWVLSGAVVSLGLLTAALSALAGRVQADVKSSLAFASLTQVGLITAEIGLGLRYLPLIHIIGHACLRTLQLIRAPNLLHDYRSLENAIGAHLPSRPDVAADWLGGWWRTPLYRLGMERGYLDALIDEYIVRPFVAVFEWCDGCEQRWTAGLTRWGMGTKPTAAPLRSTEESI